MALKKRVRLIKKIRVSSGVWQFVSMPKINGRYVWDKRPGYFFLEWWEGRRRRRQLAGQTPSEASEAQRRKTNELIGELFSGGSRPVPENADHEQSATPIADAIRMFLEHVRVHSPDKPKTHQRYRKVLEHVERILGKRKFVEAITRADIDEYKTKRSTETSQQHKGRIITPRTINYEVCVLRTFFYFLINERGLAIKNPCARFKALKDPKTKAKRRPPTYNQAELDKLFTAAGNDRTMFATLLMTGFREQELCYLTWDDVRIKNPRVASVEITSKEGFSPKDYEERTIPIPEELAKLLKEHPCSSRWVFPGKSGGRISHPLRKLQEIAERAGVKNATLHKFRHTFATRLLESGTDVVTVKNLMGHSDIETTLQYLSPDERLQRTAIKRLRLPGTTTARPTQTKAVQRPKTRPMRPKRDSLAAR